MLTQDYNYIKRMILIIIAYFGIGVACAIAAQMAYSALGLVPTLPGPTPLPMSLTYLPLPDAAITPGPAVTPDWENDRYTLLTRDLNSEVEIYSNRFGLQWLANDSIRLTTGVVDGQYTSGAELRHASEVEGRQWSYIVVFPWPQDEQPLQRIDGTTRTDSPSSRDLDARGPAVAEFVERHPNTREVNPSDDVPLARCRHHVHGQITLTSVSPVVGNFQFACQFDATEYALVSGWFWE